ncbi:MAG: DUF488 family protein [Gemmatimonadota bacterium]
MAIRVLRLGTPRSANEGVRIGTVRRPPRGVAKTEFAKQNWYDVWLPIVAPSADLMSDIHAERISWGTFTKRYVAEMKEPDAARTIDLLAALSHTSSFSVGCYCENEAHCHRSVLRQLLLDRGARIAS